MTVFEKMKDDIAEMPVQEFADIYIKCSDVPRRFQCCEKEGKEWGEDFTCGSCKRAWLESETFIGSKL